MQLELPFGPSRDRDPQDEPCTCGCYSKMKLLEQELAKLHAYLRILLEKRKAKG